MPTDAAADTADRPRTNAEAAPAPGGRRPGLALELAERYGLIVVAIVVVAAFGIFSPTGGIFLGAANLSSLAGNQVVVCLVALAALVPLAAGYFDLSAGAICGIASIVTAIAMQDFAAPLPVAILAGIVTGVLCGLLNGALIARFKLSPIITTLGTSTALQGLMTLLTGGQTISNDLAEPLLDFGQLNFLGIPNVVFALVPVVVVSWFLLEHTPFGRHLRAISSNPVSAKLVGINVDRSAWKGFLIAGAIAGIAGVILVGRAGSADSTTGPSFLFPALAAIFLGATTVRPGTPNVVGTVIGIFFVALCVSALSLLGASAWVPSFFNGVVLVIAATMASYFARRRGARRLF